MRSFSFQSLMMILVAAGTAPLARGADPSLNGVWLDPAGGIFTVKAAPGRFVWIGQGATNGKYFLRKGAGTTQGNTLQGNWIDLPESQFYPGEGTMSGTLAEDGQTIIWRASAGASPKWVRRLGAPAAPPVTSAAPVNLLRNGSFESGFNSPWGVGQYGANGIWWNSGNCQSRVDVDTQTSHGGKASLHIVNSSARAPNVYGTTVQRIAIQPDREYRITLWAKGRNLASKGAVHIIVDPAWRIRPLVLPAGTFEWQPFEATFRLPSAAAEFRILSEDRGEVWIDDVNVVPATN